MGSGDLIYWHLSGARSTSRIWSVMTALRTPSNRSVVKSITMLSLLLMRSSSEVKSRMNSECPTTLYSFHYDSFLASAMAKSV